MTKGNDSSSLLCYIAILTVSWSILSLQISMNLDIWYPTNTTNLMWWNDGGDGRERVDVELLNETMRLLISSTPVQTRPNIKISGGPSHMIGYQFEHCEVSCNYVNDGGDCDGSFGSSDPSKGISLTMESITNYPQHDYLTSKRNNRVVMNTQLISDVPVHYNNWEYRYMRPIEYDIKPESAMASSFISNCGASSFRMRAIDLLREHNITIEQYGNCGNTRKADENDKLNAISRHVFTLAFENSEEEDYVTEKFFQSYEAGTIPVHLGAPNIDDYAPLPETYLHLRTIDDVPTIAMRMHEVYNSEELKRHYLRYKTMGLSYEFKALTDMTVPHTFCQACYAFADDKNELRRRGGEGAARDGGTNDTASACRMKIPGTSSSTTAHRYYVRERTQFVYRDLFVVSKFDGLDDVTYDDFLTNIYGVFHSYRPTWTYYRDGMGRNSIDGNITDIFELRVHRLCDKYTNVKTCLYSNDSPLVLRDDVSLRRWLIENPCGELAVVFV